MLLVRSVRLAAAPPRWRGALGQARKALSTVAAAPPLVSPPNDAVAFLRCTYCQKPLSEPLVCGGCMCVSYCGPACQRAHRAAVHEKECESFGRYARRDVRVELPTNPTWLRTAMDHRGDMTYCELLEQMGAHDGAYKLMCGCQGAPSPHRHLIEPLDGTALPAIEKVESWADYYDARGLPLDSPVAALLSFPMTLFHVLTRHLPPPADLEKPLKVHYLGPEKELFLWPLFGELAQLMPEIKLDIEMIGPVAFDLPRPQTFHGSRGGHVRLQAHRGAYHAVAGELPRADVVVALNAGLAASGYGWKPTVDLIGKRGTPFFLTDYSEYSADKAADLAVSRGLSLSVPVELNPWRAPLRQPLVAGGSVAFPWLSNGFLAGFNSQSS